MAKFQQIKEDETVLVFDGKTRFDSKNVPPSRGGRQESFSLSTTDYKDMPELIRIFSLPDLESRCADIHSTTSSGSQTSEGSPQTSPFIRSFSAPESLSSFDDDDDGDSRRSRASSCSAETIMGEVAELSSEPDDSSSAIIIGQVVEASRKSSHSSSEKMAPKLSISLDASSVSESDPTSERPTYCECGELVEGKRSDGRWECLRCTKRYPPSSSDEDSPSAKRKPRPRSQASDTIPTTHVSDSSSQLDLDSPTSPQDLLNFPSGLPPTFSSNEEQKNTTSSSSEQDNEDEDSMTSPPPPTFHTSSSSQKPNHLHHHRRTFTSPESPLWQAHLESAPPNQVPPNQIPPEIKKKVQTTRNSRTHSNTLRRAKTQLEQLQRELTDLHGALQTQNQQNVLLRDENNILKNQLMKANSLSVPVEMPQSEHKDSSPQHKSKRSNSNASSVSSACRRSRSMDRIRNMFKKKKGKRKNRKNNTLR